MKKKIIILIFTIFFYNNLQSQTLVFKINKIKNEIDLKINLPEEYKLTFYKNYVIKESIEFTGERKYNIKDYKNYKMKWRINKKYKNLEVHFFDNLDNFKEERILDYQEEQELEF